MSAKKKWASANAILHNATVSQNERVVVLVLTVGMSIRFMALSSYQGFTNLQSATKISWTLWIRDIDDCKALQIGDYSCHNPQQTRYTACRWPWCFVDMCFVRMCVECSLLWVFALLDERETISSHLQGLKQLKIVVTMRSMRKNVSFWCSKLLATGPFFVHWAVCLQSVFKATFRVPLGIPRVSWGQLFDASTNCTNIPLHWGVIGHVLPRMPSNIKF